jgi:hypothetical protein
VDKTRNETVKVPAEIRKVGVCRQLIKRVPRKGNMISILVTLVIFGVILYVVNSVIPMPAWMKTLINVIAALGICLWLLDAFGLYSTHLRLR